MEDFIWAVHETGKSGRVGFGRRKRGLCVKGCCSWVLKFPHLLRALSPLDHDWCAGGGGLLQTQFLPQHTENLWEVSEKGHKSWRKHWSLRPMRIWKRNYRLCPSLQELIAQRNQLFLIFSEDRTRGNSPRLRLKFRYTEFPSSA